MQETPLLETRMKHHSASWGAQSRTRQRVASPADSQQNQIPEYQGTSLTSACPGWTWTARDKGTATVLKKKKKPHPKQQKTKIQTKKNPQKPPKQNWQRNDRISTVLLKIVSI